METNQERTVTRIDPRDISALAKCAPRVSQLTALGNNVDLLGEQSQAKRVAILGTVNPSQTAITATEWIAQTVAKQGHIVLSGLGKGIDAIAHKQAIEANGLTIAIIAQGIDTDIYPSSNTELAEQIKANGCIATEYLDGAKPLAWHFPIRMRIITALADIVILTEASPKGSARIGIDLALAMGKPIYALPGAIDNPMAELPNELIKSGEAQAITDPRDVLTALGIESEHLGW